jgi:hypothetical protein
MSRLNVLGSLSALSEIGGDGRLDFSRGGAENAERYITLLRNPSQNSCFQFLFLSMFSAFFAPPREKFAFASSREAFE